MIKLIIKACKKLFWFESELVCLCVCACVFEGIFAVRFIILKDTYIHIYMRSFIDYIHNSFLYTSISLYKHTHIYIYIFVCVDNGIIYKYICICIIIFCGPNIRVVEIWFKRIRITDYIYLCDFFPTFIRIRDCIAKYI